MEYAKTYLRDIALKGTSIVPTLWQEEAVDANTEAHKLLPY
jgi:hypothetical protein